MPILDYDYLLCTSNNTEHYGMPDSSKKEPSEAEGLRMNLARPVNETVDTDNNDGHRTEETDLDKRITAISTDSNGGKNICQTGNTTTNKSECPG